MQMSPSWDWVLKMVQSVKKLISMQKEYINSLSEL